MNKKAQSSTRESTGTTRKRSRTATPETAKPIVGSGHSTSVEDYLKHTLVILLAQQRQSADVVETLTDEQKHDGLLCERIKTGELAAALGVAPASVTGMVQRLAEEGLMHYEAYRGIGLTERGCLEALRLIRKHRLIELLLVQVLGYNWDEVHDEAERLEHAVSDTLTERIATVLGHPTHDPHGDPIPLADGSIVSRPTVALIHVAAGHRVRVARIPDEDGGFLRYCASIGLVPGAQIKVVSVAPYGGPIELNLGKSRVAIGPSAAQQIDVEDLGI